LVRVAIEGIQQDHTIFQTKQKIVPRRSFYSCGVNKALLWMWSYP